MSKYDIRPMSGIKRLTNILVRIDPASRERVIELAKLETAAVDAEEADAFAAVGLNGHAEAAVHG